MNKNTAAARLADLTFTLLARCQEREAWLAEEHGLSHSEFKCLRPFDVDEIVNNKKIAEKMNLSPSRSTRIIDGLVKKGYMKRDVDPSDRRNMKVYLSTRGKELTNKLNKAFIDFHSKILQDIVVSQHEPLITGMGHLNVAVEKWLEKPR